MSMRVGEKDVIGNSGKKSKRSKKIETVGVEERSDRMGGEEDGLGEVGKKRKKSKKKEMDGVEEMSACLDLDVELLKNLEPRVGKKKRRNKGNDMVAGEESFNGESFGQFDIANQLEKVEKKRKKNKENNMVAGEEFVSGKSFWKFDTDNQLEKVNNKKKKDKKLLVSSEEVTDSLDAATTEEASSLSLNKGEKKLKCKIEHEVPINSLLNDTQDEDSIVEKRKKIKTKRKRFESGENPDALNEKIVTEARERNNVVGNVEKKKRKKRKRAVEEENDSDKGKENTAGGEDVENSLVDSVIAREKVKMKEEEEIIDMDGHSNKAQDNESTNLSKKKEKTKLVGNDPKISKSKEKKKVRFSEHLEVFYLPDIVESDNEENEKGRLVRGKRFTPEEDDIVKAAVEKYIESHCLGKKGLEMVMNCKSHRQVKNCWKEIGAVLPHRPTQAVYYRAHILFEAGERLEWTEEERKMLLEHNEKHGNNWKLLAEEFKRHRFHVKDTFRRIKLKRNIGHWSQEEYQNLFDHVNVDLRAKAKEEKKSKHGMLRDNICWTAISDRLSTRSDSTCCAKWYKQLTSSMVVQGIWADSDDYRLLDALFNLDACCIEDVDWDKLIDQRSGFVCRKRWDQMVLHIGSHGVKSFAEQVEILAKRYRPELIEAREAWDSKPLVP
ncbi:uncharacterized protein LOC141711741 isoform X1 [Apium graveolens]|uniref:uncharacterized protein LOC141711741 isoform X1 n=1 Tax=Apium graveolens TaxID=4045 RepID=UPI003D798462